MITGPLEEAQELESRGKKDRGEEGRASHFGDRGGAAHWDGHSREVLGLSSTGVFSAPECFPHLSSNSDFWVRWATQALPR